MDKPIMHVYGCNLGVTGQIVCPVMLLGYLAIHPRRPGPLLFFSGWIHIVSGETGISSWLGSGRSEYT